MIKVESGCVSCGLPCLYEGCPYYKEVHAYCDKCEFEEDLYDFEGEQLCEDCIFERLDTRNHVLYNSDIDEYWVYSEEESEWIPFSEYLDSLHKISQQDLDWYEEV